MRRKTSHRNHNNKRPNNNFRKRRGMHSGPGRGGKTFEGKNRQQAMQGRERYLGLAQDALRGGDRVQAEYYFQYADHFARILDYFEAQEREFESQRSDDGWNNDFDAQDDEAADDGFSGGDEPQVRASARAEISSRDDRGRDDRNREGRRDNRTDGWDAAGQGQGEYRDGLQRQLRDRPRSEREGGDDDSLDPKTASY